MDEGMKVSMPCTAASTVSTLSCGCWWWLCFSAADGSKVVFYALLNAPHRALQRAARDCSGLSLVSRLAPVRSVVHFNYPQYIECMHNMLQWFEVHWCDVAQVKTVDLVLAHNFADTRAARFPPSLRITNTHRTAAMPELPEVECTRRLLAAHLLNKKIVDVTVLDDTSTHHIPPNPHQHSPFPTRSGARHRPRRPAVPATGLSSHRHWPKRQAPLVDLCRKQAPPHVPPGHEWCHDHPRRGCLQVQANGC